MQLHHVLASGLCAAALAAQQNPFIVFPQDPERMTITSSSYIRRPNWNAQAEGLQQLDASWFRGIGDAGAGCVVRGFYQWAADENSTTAETYGIVFRGVDPTVGGPDVSPAGTLFSLSGLTTPTQAPASRITWLMTDVFATPVAVPCEQGWFQGIAFGANPAWPATDGHSLWGADAPSAHTPATVGENCRASAPDVTWSVNASFTTATTAWTYIMGALIDAPVLHLGGIDPLSSRTGTLGAPSYGMNGLFPDILAVPAHGLNARVQDHHSPQGLALFAAAFSFDAPLSFGPPGSLYLPINSALILGFSPLQGGAATLPIASPGTIPPSLVGTSVMFQAVVLDPVSGNFAFTNAQAALF
jgi:hypothetical protein